jgi:hypothetical protein
MYSVSSKHGNIEHMGQQTGDEQQTRQPGEERPGANCVRMLIESSFFLENIGLPRLEC